MPARTAVVLCNLGGPDSLAAVEGFLVNLFSDPDIFRLPLARLTQKPFARWFARRRVEEASAGYAAIGGRSPLLENTRKQAWALQQALGENYEVLIYMRYWHPLAHEVVAELKQKNYRDVFLLPLYPQYSTTTTGSAFNEFRRACVAQAYAPNVRHIDHWYDDAQYQDAVVGDIRKELAQFSEPQSDKVELLFSAHGLPEKVIARGDPYERQIRATYDTIAAKLKWPHTTLCYQSRVGPLPWLKPYTEDTIRAKAAAGAKQILVYPIAFVSDHIETLFELGQTYAALAHSLGVREYRVVPALNAHPALIAALKRLVTDGGERYEPTQ